MKEIKEIYEDYLRSENKKYLDIRRRDEGEEIKFSASSAWHCLRKHWYKMNGQDKKKQEWKDLARLRLGTIIHDDIQTALRNSGKSFLCESVLSDENIVGHQDVMYLIFGEDKLKAELYDIKTMASFPWKRKFGRIENRDPNPSKKYPHQVLTYKMLAEKQFNLKVIKSQIIYIKLDQPWVWKTEDVSDDLIKETKEYWEIVNLMKQFGTEPIPGDDKTPVESWECKYCPFSHVCNSPFK